MILSDGLACFDYSPNPVLPQNICFTIPVFREKVPGEIKKRFSVNEMSLQIT